MFFSISTEKFDDRFFNHVNISNYYISLDAGWHQTRINKKEVFYKGYCDSVDMSQIIHEFSLDPKPRYRGNFGLIIVDHDSLTVTHDLNRSFPLNINNNGFLTNLTKLNSREPIWADRYVVYKNLDIDFVFFDPYDGLAFNFDEKLSLEQCANEIKDILDEKTKYLFNTTLPINLYLSGGLDTTLLYAYTKYHLEKNDIDYSIVTCQHNHYNKFLQKNHWNLKKEFAVYLQAHSFKNPCLMFNGAPGDEATLRGPYAASMWTIFKDIDILEISESNEYYHKKYYQKPKVKKFITDNYDNRQEILKEYPTYEKLCRQIINVFVNDHQIWHLNDTINWTPFKDPRILELVLRLNDEELLLQILDGKLTKLLVTMYDPLGLRILSDYKNHDNYDNFKNDPLLDKLFE